MAGLLAELVIDRVDIVFVASAVDFKRLQKEDELSKVRLPVDAQHVGQTHRSSTQIAENDDKQVDQVVKRVSLMLPEILLRHLLQSHTQTRRNLFVIGLSKVYIDSGLTLVVFLLRDPILEA